MIRKARYSKQKPPAPPTLKIETKEEEHCLPVCFVRTQYLMSLITQPYSRLSPVLLKRERKKSNESPVSLSVAVTWKN